jgi:hypothetical protein
VRTSIRILISVLLPAPRIFGLVSYCIHTSTGVLTSIPDERHYGWENIVGTISRQKLHQFAKATVVLKNLFLGLVFSDAKPSRTLICSMELFLLVFGAIRPEAITEHLKKLDSRLLVYRIDLLPVRDLLIPAAIAKDQFAVITIEPIPARPFATITSPASHLLLLSVNRNPNLFQDRRRIP